MVLSRTGVASLAVLAGALVFGVVLGFVLAFGVERTEPVGGALDGAERARGGVRVRGRLHARRGGVGQA